MKVSVVAREHPDPHGTAAGRALWAWCEGLRALGCELEAWSWHPHEPRRALPAWCTWMTPEPVPRRRAHVQALRRPRAESAALRWSPQTDAVAIADDVASFAAVHAQPQAVATIPSLSRLDAWATAHVAPYRVQEARAEGRARRGAGLVFALSGRVARRLRGAGHRVQVVPVAYPVPQSAVVTVEEPVAALYADWSWRPNYVALRWLLTAWPVVHEAVAGSRLVLAGPHLDRLSIGTPPGVSCVGEVRASEDVLSQAAVVAYPCPRTSGPKARVLDSLAHGVHVVTTPAGVEGLALAAHEGALVVPRRHFADALAGLLRSPERRAALGASGREAVTVRHGPVPAARARLAALCSAFGGGPS